MPNERQELLAQLFVMLTAKLEDAHHLAVAGQIMGTRPGRLLFLARQLREAALDLVALAEVIIVLTDRPPN